MKYFREWFYLYKIDGKNELIFIQFIKMFSLSKIHSILSKRNICVSFHKTRFVGSTNMLGHSVCVSVLKDGTVRIIFKGNKYQFEKAFGDYLTMNFQLFVKNNIIVLFSGNKFVSFIFENDILSKIEYRQVQSSVFKCFVKPNLIVLYVEKSILSFILENDTFTMRHYPIRHRIDGGILTFVKKTPYFVCCIHPSNSPLIAVSINLFTGQQNNVVEKEKSCRFCSFKHKNADLFIITSPNNETIVDPLKISETRESFTKMEESSLTESSEVVET